MSWRRPWCAALLLLLLLLTGREASSQQGDGELTPLKEDYTTVPDYPDEIDYDDDYFDEGVYAPYIGNTTLHKCRCPASQAWDGKQCLDAATAIIVVNHFTDHHVMVNASEFGAVEVFEVVCPEGHSKVVVHLQHFQDFAVMDYGPLYWRHSLFNYFCIDHTLAADGETIAMEAHVCLPVPPVSVCCPAGHAIHLNGTCYPDDAALNVPLTMQVEGQQVTWNIDDMAEITNITCNFGDTHYRRLTDANVSLVYDPHGLQLQWLAPATTKPRNRQEYCLGVEVDGGVPHYSTLFCYKDKAIAHREACHNATCVRKCCLAHEIMYGADCAVPHDPALEWAPKFHHSGSLAPNASPPADLAIVHGLPICRDIFQLLPYEVEDDKYYLLQDGSLYVPSFKERGIFPPTLYCLENFMTPDDIVLEHPLVCFDDNSVLCNSVRNTAYPALQAVSCVFLAVTLLVYVSVPELHAKVHGKCLVSHVTALLLAYLCLIIVQMTSGTLPEVACKIMASLTHISFLAAFFWLNVMCFDIWWTLKSMRPVAETGELSRLRFKLYSFYSWGCPVVISAVAIIVDSLPEEMDDVLRPGFGTMKCWFADNRPLWAYFYGFVLTLVVANIILFCQVAYILIMAQNDPILQRTRQQNRERMWLYIKLFVVMGLTWIMEVISWQEGSCEAWIIPDVINALQGFSIFLIFICKRNMLKRIRTNWEPYLRRMKMFVGSSRQPDSNKGKGVRDTSSFTSSVNRPSSQSNASQRTVQSQISLDTMSSIRKLSTSSMVSTTGVQIHTNNSLCMDTINEATASEAEEMAAQEDTHTAYTTTPATTHTLHDTMSPAATSNHSLAQEEGNAEAEEQVAEVEATEERERGSEDDGSSKESPGHHEEEVTVSAASPESPQNTRQEGESGRGDVESVTVQQHLNQAFVTDDLEEQPIHV